MKSVRALVHCGAFLGAGFLAARADGGSASSPPPASANEPAAHPTNPTGPWLMWSPPSQPVTVEAPEWNGATGDGVGEGGTSTSDATDPQNAERIAEQTYQANLEKQEHPEEQNVAQIAKQQAYDDDWLLRGYTQQLKKRHLEKSDYSNPYLVPDPVDSSKGLMGEDPLQDLPEDNKPAHKNTPSKSAFNDASTLTPRKPLSSASFQPLLSPLNPPGSANPASGTDNLSPDAPDSFASLLPVPNIQPSETTLNSQNNLSEPSLLDVPGLTAASQGGLTPSAGLDLDESGANKRARPADDFLIPTAPASDVSEFFRKQAEGLAPKTVPGTVAAITPPPKPRPILNEEPIAKPAISGLRTHVDDPFDILQR